MEKPNFMANMAQVLVMPNLPTHLLSISLVRDPNMECVCGIVWEK